MILFIYPPKFCISIVFVFSWDHCRSEEKLETMLLQNIGGANKEFMVFSEVAYFCLRSVFTFIFQDHIKAALFSVCCNLFIHFSFS